jgi:hypothetical protein
LLFIWAQAAGGDVEFHLYPKVGHAFMTGFTPDGITNMKTIGCPVRDTVRALLFVCMLLHEGGSIVQRYDANTALTTG